MVWMGTKPFFRNVAILLGLRDSTYMGLYSRFRDKYIYSASSPRPKMMVTGLIFTELKDTINDFHFSSLKIGIILFLF